MISTHTLSNAPINKPLSAAYDLVLHGDAKRRQLCHNSKVSNTKLNRCRRLLWAKSPNASAMHLNWGSAIFRNAPAPESSQPPMHYQVRPGQRQATEPVGFSGRIVGIGRVKSTANSANAIIPRRMTATAPIRNAARATRCCNAARKNHCALRTQAAFRIHFTLIGGSGARS